jgi:hypothetical protein
VSGQSSLFCTLYNLVQSGCSLHQISGFYDGKYQDKNLVGCDFPKHMASCHTRPNGCNVFPSIVLPITHIFRNFGKIHTTSSSIFVLQAQETN